MVYTRSSSCRSLKKRLREGTDTSSRRKTIGKKYVEAKLERHNLRVSVQLELGIEILTPSLKRKSDRLENCNSPYAVRRPSASSCSQNSAEHRTPVSGRNLSSLIMESEKAELNMEEVIGFKRKNMTGRSFKSIYRRQRVLKDLHADNASDEILRTTVGNLECENAGVASRIRGDVSVPGLLLHHLIGVNILIGLGLVLYALKREGKFLLCIYPLGL
ncbi:hypothetical protein M569_13855 [Genlisea aurea]|uniref:Uncharacterized protein n=1 Tax=Genlisea aurea TaxID=192259 RepID=S8C9C6_9LAMI|nr:hypothetical protein M569_13855 [Genlisea aurea]